MEVFYLLLSSRSNFDSTVNENVTQLSECVQLGMLCRYARLLMFIGTCGEMRSDWWPTSLECKSYEDVFNQRKTYEESKS